MKTIQIINKLVARDLNKSENEVAKVNEFFWKETRKKLSSLESASVAIKHIGTVTTSKRKISFYIKQMIGKIRGVRKSDRYKESTKAILLDLYFDKLRKALIQRNKLSIRYNEAYISRSKRVRKTTSDNTSEFRQDIGGDDKPSEEGIGDITGGSTSRDSEEKIDLLDMSI